MKTTKWLLVPLALLPAVATAASGAAPRDRDHDRLPDRWEKRYHLSTSKKSAKGDADRDGLRNLREYRLRTNPRKKDTDGDGLNDRAEVRRHKTNPRKKDTDGDGLNDRAEVRRHKTNPRRKDTDGDGFRDRVELRAGTDPRAKKSHPSKGGSAPAPAPAPAPAAYPNDSNTGVPPGTTLTPSGSLTINTAGAVIEGRDITGGVTVNAPNVTIRNSRIRSTGQAGIYNNSSGLVVEDVEVDCGDAVGHTGITPQGYTARRVNAHGCDNTFWAERDVVIADSYVHGVIDYDPATDPHTDGVQLPGGASNITLEHNTIYGNYVSRSSFGNSAITGNGTGYSNITINDNLLAGGGYTLYCPADKGSNYRLTNNRFSRIFVSTVGGFGPWQDCRDEGGSGNVYYETGEPL